ncbi:MAG TPA: transposase [Pyrinomonadaceae bacterium]|nr:transposase [Pyrinomonadaceae bacterium]
MASVCIGFTLTHKEDRRIWLKLHLMCRVKTNIVTSVQVSDGYAHDYPYFKGLVDRTADAGLKMREVSGDKGYLGASNMLATLQRGAIPYIHSSRILFLILVAVTVRNQSYGPACITSTR